MKHNVREKKYEASEQGIASDPALRGSGVQARAERAPSSPPVSVVELAPPLISIGSPADIALLEPTYAYLSTYTFACLSPRLAERLNVAIYELYSNALRHGSASGQVRLELHKTTAGVRLTVGSSAEPARRERLERQLARVKQDPEAAFTSEMDRFAGGSATPPMLGIVRVVHESRLAVELSVNGDRISVTTLCED